MKADEWNCDGNWFEAVMFAGHCSKEIVYKLVRCNGKTYCLTSLGFGLSSAS